LSSTAKYEQDLFSNEDLNLIYARLGKALLKGDEKRGLRNYFLQRAKAATNAHQLLSALKGLQVLIDVPNVNLEGEARVSLATKTQ
jgi:hypothetical protein